MNTNMALMVEVGGPVPATRTRVYRDDSNVVAPYQFAVFPTKKGYGSLAFALGDWARIKVEDGEVKLWVGHACVALRSRRDAQAIAKALSVPIELPTRTGLEHAEPSEQK